jgi:hypothetical protein
MFYNVTIKDSPIRIEHFSLTGNIVGKIHCILIVKCRIKKFIEELIPDFKHALISK